jgi:alpha-maltose-1-phosphate synthase
MKIILSSFGRFHFFHLARQMEKRGWLQKVFSTYPWLKLRYEHGIPAEKILTDPLIETLMIGKARFGLNFPTIDEWLDRRKRNVFDKFILKNMSDCDVFIGLSGSGLAGGRCVQEFGGRYICERSSSHIVVQNELLTEEHSRWGSRFTGISPAIIDREMEEYDAADFVMVPSRFVEKSFLSKGIPSRKIVRNALGVELKHFFRTGDPSADEFVVLFVGQASFRKGIPYLLEAFRSFQHPRKRLILVGLVDPDIRPYLRKAPLEHVRFVGPIAHRNLAELMSMAQVLVLPSIEEGWGLVQAEALACGCPVIATANTGASDLFESGREGFIVPIRSSDAILACLERLADDPSLRDKMSWAAQERMKGLGGWDRYGARYAAQIEWMHSRRDCLG